MKNSPFFISIVAAIILIGIISTSCDGCQNETVPPSNEDQPNGEIVISGGEQCLDPINVGEVGFKLTINVTSINSAGTVTQFWTNNGPKDIKQVKRVDIGPSSGPIYVYGKPDGTQITNINTIPIFVPKTGAFNVSVQLESTSCIRCCLCFGMGGIAILKGESMQTSNSGVPIDIFLNHQSGPEGCPLEKCCQ